MQPRSPREWYDKAVQALKESEYDHIVSWHLRIQWNLPTKMINYHLGRLCAAGFLKKETEVYCIRYYLTDKNPDDVTSVMPKHNSTPRNIKRK